MIYVAVFGFDRVLHANISKCMHENVAEVPPDSELLFRYASSDHENEG